MRSDLFYKVVLTVIAGCLFVLAVKAFMPVPVEAEQDQVINVRIVGIDTDYRGTGFQPLPVDLKRIGGDGYAVNDLRQLLRAKK